MFRLKVENGSFVQKGDVLGVIQDPFGEFERNVVAPIINKGDALFHISVEVGCA
jgi:predicted deacylase